MIIIVMGVSGSGKTTISRMLANQVGWPFYGGDTFHPEANVEKMTEGTALTDADRSPWLSALRALIEQLIRENENAVIACSALKQAYRDRLKQGDDAVRFVYLKGSRALILRRMEARAGHFMPPDLLDSQLAVLEEPRDALTVDITPPPETIVARIRDGLGV